MNKCLTLFLLCMSLNSYSQQQMSIDQVCEITKCSEDIKLAIRVTESGYYDGVWPKRPYFFNGTGSIVIGEYLSFEATSDDEGNITLKYLPEKTKNSINIRLEQPGNKKNDVMTMATIENGSQFNLIYKGGIYHSKSGKFGPTTVCAIQAGLSSYESWPYAISLFSFSNIKSVSKNDVVAHGCK